MTAPKRVAVLGGGVSAMTAAFELTRPELCGQYDVTVYQMGWRLGGKGASGRNREIANRIEEHGLHIWMGFYENAFKVMQDAYGELNRTVGPLQTWEDAFKKHSYIVLGEPLAGKEDFWQLVFPTNECVPGEDPNDPTIWEIAAYILIWIYNHWQSSSASKKPTLLGAPPIPPWIEALARESEGRGGLHAPPPIGCIGMAAGPPPASIDGADVHDPGSGRLARAIAIARASAKDGQTPPPNVINAIITMIQDAMSFVKSLLGSSIESDFLCFQIWVAVNLGGSSVIGILKDDVITKGWNSIDGLDLRAWLGKHGADADTTLASGPIRGIYDLAFCYVDGDIKNPQFAAGTAMRGMLKMAFAYKGAIFYKMQAGMGDTVFTPLYRVLKNRGVKFEFFHKVTDVKVDVATQAVSSIDFIEQAQLTGGDYEPLLDVLGLGCWPSEPLYEQIQFGEDLKASGIDFESSWAPAWQYSQPKTINAGVDFDLVVYGISVGALAQSASSLLAASIPLQGTFANVKTVQTCAFQLWLKPDLTGLGWVDPSTTTERPVLGGFVEPLDTWSDMSQLLVRETWPEGFTPLNVAYFCGVFDQANPIPPYSDCGFPAKELARLDAKAIPFLNDNVGTLWPSTVTPDGFNWDLLVDLNADVGPARFQSQFRRVNIDPTERYVLSVPNSTSFRLPPDGTGIANVFITGDWIQCGLNAGCVEAAVTAGMLTARAITGATTPIHGECDRLLAPRPR